MRIYYQFAVLDANDDVIIITDDFDLACGYAITRPPAGTIPKVGIWIYEGPARRQLVDILKYRGGRWRSDQEERIYDYGETKRIGAEI